jgi:hypothetical protein
LSKADLDVLSNSDSTYVESVKKAKDGTYTARVQEHIQPIADNAGYVPHFFHDFFIVRRDLNKGESAKAHTETVTKAKYVAMQNDKTIHITDANSTGGKYKVKYTQDVYDSKLVGSAKSAKDAVKAADKMEHESGGEYFISPKEFNFEGDEMNPAVVGDKDYDKIVNNFAESMSISTKEAKEMLKNSVREKNKHRFYGNFLHRSGAEGFEKDMRWVIQHHIASASRYIALDPFKYRTMNLFERAFGAYDKDYNAWSREGFIKGYINSMNGVPTWLERFVTSALNHIPGFKEHFSDPNGGLGARALGYNITSAMSVMKLGFLNMSSAILNTLQITNAGGYLGWKAVLAGARRVRNLSDADKAILKKLGIDTEVGLDTANGFQKLHVGSEITGGKKWAGMTSTHTGIARVGDYMGQIFNKSMVLFNKSEQFIRRTTALSAYYKGLSKGMSEREALAYADEVNRKTNFDYGEADAPRIFRSLEGTVIGPTLLQFQKYAIKECETISDFMPLLGKSTNLSQKMNFWLPYGMLAGAFGMIPLEDMIFQALGNLPGVNDNDLKASAKKAIMNWAGSSPIAGAIAKTALYGIGGVAGVDISYRLGLPDIFPKWEGLQSAFGATGSTVAGIWRALSTGDLLYGLKMTSPGLSNIYQAATGQTESQRGRLGVQYDAYDRMLRLMGFRTTDEAEASDLKSIDTNWKKNHQNDRSSAIDSYLKDSSYDNYSKLQELGVTDKQVESERAKKSMPSTTRTKTGMTKMEGKDLEGASQFVQ